jgi:glycosyltransferase involved in cell wall biosynthesis
MKVLLSAYACEPGRGSEPGIGWNWANEIARLGHDVHVITRASNRKAIEAWPGPLPAGLSFHYYDLKPWLRFWKRGNRGLTLYYWLWQAAAARFARDLHAAERFDLVHHLTFGSIKLPTFMHSLGVPLVLGPIGGGETAPLSLRKGYSLRGHVSDALRDMSRSLARHNPFISAMLWRATVIVLATPANLDFVPAARRDQVRYLPAVGAPPTDMRAPRSGFSSTGAIRILYVGRFLHWKGLHLALHAADVLRRRGVKFCFTLVGHGPEKEHLQRMARRLGLESFVEWRQWLPQAELAELYRDHDIFLFPSLHDSGGSVVLEAAAHGLPTVCLDLGGPAMLVTADTGVKIPVEGASGAAVSERLANALAGLAEDPDTLDRLRRGALARAQRASWASLAEDLYDRVASSPEQRSNTGA